MEDNDRTRRDDVQIDSKKINNTYTRFLAGGLSGILEVSISHPIDVVKTAMQDKSTNNKVKMSPHYYLIDRFKRGGVRHLYRGYLPRVLGVIPMRSMFWGAQSTTYSYLDRYDISIKTKSMIAGTIGGATQTLIDNPIEAMKTRIITSAHVKNKTTEKAEPIPRLRFPGFGPTLFRNVGFMVAVTQITSLYDGDSYLVRFALGGTGGFIGSIATQPIDYVKTKMQSAQYDGRGAIQIFSETLKNNPKNLMVGLVSRASLGFINMSVGYLAFSLLTKLFDS